MAVPVKLKKPKAKSRAAKPKKNSGNRRFSRLIRSLSQSDTKVVLSLGGGGIRMFAHVSVLKFLETLGVERYISEIWGASGGAIVGLLYSMGNSPEEIFESARALHSAQLKIQLTPSLFSIVKNIALESLLNHSNSHNLTGFHNIQEGLQQLVKQTSKDRGERFPFYCLTYNLGTNSTDVLAPREIPLDMYPNFIYRADPVDAITASSAIPILFVPKTIEDEGGRRVYTDGATGEEVPTVSIYKKWLRDKELGLETRKRLLVIAVDLHPDLSHLGFLENWLLRKIPAFQYILMTIHL